MRVKIKPEIAAMEFEPAPSSSSNYHRIQLPSGRSWFIPKEYFDIIPEPWKVGGQGTGPRRRRVRDCRDRA